MGEERQNLPLLRTICSVAAEVILSRRGPAPDQQFVSSRTHQIDL